MLRPLFLSFLYLCHRISIPQTARIMQVFVFREYKSVSICGICGSKKIPFVGK